MPIPLGKQLKIIREARGVSQWELATKTGIDRSRLSLIENGYAEPSDAQLESIKSALDWTPELDEHLEALAAEPAR